MSHQEQRKWTQHNKCKIEIVVVSIHVHMSERYTLPFLVNYCCVDVSLFLVLIICQTTQNKYAKLYAQNARNDLSENRNSVWADKVFAQFDRYLICECQLLTLTLHKLHRFCCQKYQQKQTVFAVFEYAHGKISNANNVLGIVPIFP